MRLERHSVVERRYSAAFIGRFSAAGMHPSGSDLNVFCALLLNSASQELFCEWTPQNVAIADEDDVTDVG